MCDAFTKTLGSQHSDAKFCKSFGVQILVSVEPEAYQSMCNKGCTCDGTARIGRYVQRSILCAWSVTLGLKALQ
jgi:hypothetical protein